MLNIRVFVITVIQMSALYDDGSLAHKNDVFFSIPSMIALLPSLNYPSINSRWDWENWAFAKKSQKVHSIVACNRQANQHQIWLNTQFKEAWLIAKCICVHSIGAGTEIP